MKNNKLWTIRAYCSTCHRLLMESNSFTKKELIKRWDSGVLGASGIPCKDCNYKVPNFNIDLRVYNSGSKLEFQPKDVIPNPKYDITQDVSEDNQTFNS